MGVRISQLDAAASTDYVDGAEFMMNGTDGGTKRGNLADLRANFLCDIRCGSVTIPTAQVLTLNTVPVEIVAAPGAGYAIEVISGVSSIVYNSVTYATNTTIGLISAGADDSQYELDFLAATITKKNVLSPNLSSNNRTQMLENTALNVTVQTGDPTAGDSDITVYVTYRLIEI